MIPKAAAARMSLSAALKEFLQEPRSLHTNRQYRVTLTTIIGFLGRNRRMTSITYTDLLKYLDDMRQRTNRRGKPFSEVTIKGHVGVIKAFFSWCVDAGLIDHSPAARLKTHEPKTDTAENKAIPEYELQGMIDFCRHNHRNYALILFLTDTGCRVGGCSSLRISRLDLDNCEAVLHEKGDRRHKVMFGPETAAALRKWLTVRPRVNHDYVWTGQGPDYQPIDRTGIAAVIRRAATATGASKAWGPHSIRHYVGHKLAKSGVAVTGIQRKLGHTNPQTTMRAYMPQDDDYLREISDEFAFQSRTPKSDPSPGKVVTVADWRRGA